MTAARILTTLLLCSAMSCSFASKLERSDLELLCKVAGTIEQDATMDQKQRLVAIGTKLVGKNAGPALRTAWRAIEVAPPRLRRAAYREMLDQNDLKGFKCAPLEKILKVK